MPARREGARSASRSRSRSRSRSCSRGGRGRSRSFSRGGRGGRGRSHSLERSPPRRGGRFGVGRRGRSSSGARGRGPARGGSRSRAPKQTEWDCPNCKHLNYPRRDECQKCKTPRPTGDEREAFGKERPAVALPQGQAPAGAPGAHYALVPYGAPPPGAAWGTAPGAAAWHAQHYQRRDYATEKPQAYQAFLAHIRHGIDGVEVFLGNQMCQDHHVDDLLACLESFLARTIAQPWRIGRLDLARNGLSDDSVVKVVERLKVWSLRVKRLDLDSNKVGFRGVSALVEYVWNCPEAIVEIGLAGNKIEVTEAGKGEDPVSALLRCLYNHPAYPVKMHSESGDKIVPFILRLGDNKIEDYELLDRIQDKGGPAHVHFPDTADPYAVPKEQVFLSAHLPAYDRQGEQATKEDDKAIPAIEEPCKEATQKAYTAAPKAAEEPQPKCEEKTGAQAESEYSHYSDSESEKPDESKAKLAPTEVPPQVAPKAAEMPAEGSPGSDSDSDSYSDEGSESEEGKVEAGEMPEDMLNALDILDAAADAQVARDKAAQASSMANSPADSDIDSDESVDAESNVKAEANPAGDDASDKSVVKSDAKAKANAFDDVDSFSDESVDLKSDADSSVDGDTAMQAASKADAPASATSPGKTAGAPKAAAASSKRRAKPMKRTPPREVASSGQATEKLDVGSLELGHYADGKVTLVCDSCALVSCGVEVEGLLHVDDLMGTHKRIGKVLKVGDAVHVEVSATCKRLKRVSLRQVGARADGSSQALTAPSGTGEKKRVKIKRRVRRDRRKEAGEDEPDSNDDALAVAAGKSRARKKCRKEDKVDESGSGEDGFDDVIQRTLSDEEQKHLERDVIAHLDEATGLKIEAEDKAELAELVLRLIRAGKRPSAIETELTGLMKGEAKNFTAWLVEHVKGPFLRAARSRMGATPKAAAKKAGSSPESS